MNWNNCNNSIQNRCSKTLNASCIDCSCCHRRPMAYVCGGTSGYVAVVDLIEGRNIMNIDCGENSYPYNIAANPSSDCAYVADYERNMVLKLNLADGIVVDMTAVVGTPVGISVSPCGCFVYVVFQDEPILQILHAGSLENIASIALPVPGNSVFVTADCQTAYITLPSLNQTAVVNLCLNSVSELLNTGINPGRMAVSYECPLILVAGRGNESITPINTCRIRPEESIFLGAIPSGLDFICGTRECLVALANENSAAVVDICTHQVLNRIPVGIFPGDVAASKVFPLAVVGNQTDGTLSVIDTNAMSNIATVYIGGTPSGIAVVD